MYKSTMYAFIRNKSYQQDIPAPSCLIWEKKYTCDAKTEHSH